ncbi:MAG: tetratricopeptide repeat protein, partial [Verrucomicrobia bacterium]|nr:tetratricopeptide repeat protein [Verrucomicrobiota bacterium]
MSPENFCMINPQPEQPAAIEIPQSLYGRILEKIDQGLFLDAYHLGLQSGPLHQWAGPKAQLLAGRLAQHLGGKSLSWRLTSKAYRQRPNSARFLTQRIYGLMEQRGLFSAWQASHYFARCETETPLEKAESLVCRGCLSVSFRDFETANDYLTQAQRLAPTSPWIWTASSTFWAQQGKHERALQLIDDALAIQPWYRPAIQYKAEYLQATDRDAEAFEVLETAKQQLQSHGVILQLIILHSEHENWARMLDLSEEARRLAPLAEKPLESWLTARETDALIGLQDFERAAQKAGKVFKAKFYQNLASKLKQPASPARRIKIPVPHILQEHNACVPATLSALTAFWNRRMPQETIIDEICYDGTPNFAQRRWAEANGWFTKEFKVTLEAATALLDRGIPFLLTTTEIESAHSQAVIGYDTIRESLLIRDPSVRHYREHSWKEFFEHYEATGPHGMLLLPAEKAHLIEDIHLPESDLYDLHHEINCALAAYDRARAEAALVGLQKAAPNHRLYWMGQRALAHYDENPVLDLEAVSGLQALFPDDDRLLYARVNLLRMLGRNQEVLQSLRTRLRKPDVPSLFGREYGRELGNDTTRSNLAIRMVLRDLKRNPQNINGLDSLASVLWNANHKDLSLKVQRLAATMADKKENTATVYFQKLLALGQENKGIEYLQKRATILLSNSGDPTLTLAHALHQLARTQEAIDILRAAVNQRPQDGALLIHLAQLEAMAGRENLSSELMESASAHTRRPDWLRAVAWLYRRQGDYDQALRSWKEIVATTPLDQEAHQEIALLTARLHGRKAAEEYVESVGRQFPHHLGLLQLETAWRNVQANAVEQRLLEFLTANPNNAWVRRELALRLQERKAYAEASHQAQFASKTDPYNPDSWQTAAVILQLQGQIDQARVSFKNALKLDINCEYAARQLLLLADSVTEKLEALSFIKEQIEQQTTAGSAINIYREIAFPILDLEQLTENLRGIWCRLPNRWEAWNALSIQLLASGNPSEAERFASDATKRFPLLAQVWRNAGVLHGECGHWDQAIKSFQFALKIAPEWTAAIHSLAEGYRRVNRQTEAIELLKQAHLRNPLDATLLGALAENLWHIGEREKAIDRIKESLALDPEYQWGLTKLSQWSRTVTQNDAALELCRECTKRFPENTGAWLSLAQLAAQSNLMDEYLQAARRAAQCDPSNVAAHDHIAIALTNQHRFAEALNACRPAAFGQKIPSALRGREAWIIACQGQPERAITTLKEVLQSDPQFRWGWELLADLSLQQKHKDTALEAAERLIRLSPATPEGYILRAQISTGDSRLVAKNDYRKALALAPSTIQSAWQLFKMQLEDGEYDEAANTLAIVDSHISQAVVLPARIILAAKRNNLDEALALVAQAAVLPEIDANAFKEAVEAIDERGRTYSLNTLLESQLRNPTFNPFIASVWVSRVGSHYSWKLLKQFNEIPQAGTAHASFLEQWLLGSNKTRYCLQAARTIREHCHGYAEKHVRVWANIGVNLVRAKHYREAVDWLKNWKSKKNLEGWMITNLVYSLHALQRRAEADSVSKDILRLGIKDHTASSHISFLTLSSLERGHTSEAQDLFNTPHQDPKTRDTQNYREIHTYLREAVKSAL